MVKKHYIFYLIISLLGCFTASSQTTIAFQGFEGTGADNWGFTPPTQNSVSPSTPVGAANYGTGYAASGTRSMRVGGGGTSCGSGGGNCMAGSSNGGTCVDNNNGDNVSFAPVDVSCYSNVSISAAYRTHVVCVGAGLDNGDRLFFEVRLNGGAWTTTATVNGTNNCVWNYATTSVVCAGPAVANPYIYNAPAGTQSIEFRIRIERNRTDEVFYVDNVSLTGTGNSLSPISIQHINP